MRRWSSDAGSARPASSRRSWDCGVDHQSFRPMTYDAIVVERMNALPDLP